MSQENVELTLLAIDAWNRRDAEALIALMDPEGVFYVGFEGMTEGRPHRGHAGVRQYFEDLAEFVGESHAEPDEVHDLGDQVLGLARTWFRFAGGVDLDQKSAVLMTWRKGKCIEARGWTGHAAHADALEAAGLRE